MDIVGLIIALLLSINEQRTVPLVIDNQLADITMVRSNDMVDRNYFSHYNPEGNTVRSLLMDIGYTGSGAEFLCRTVKDDCVDAWLNSTLHNVQLLNEDYVWVGIGIDEDDNGIIYYTVLMFDDF